MNITYLSILFSLLLFAFPVFVVVYFKLNILNRVVRAFLRMVIATGVIALITWGVVSVDNVVVDIIVALLFCLFTTVITLAKSRLKISKLLIPLAIGNFAGIAVVSFYVLFLVLVLSNPFISHIFAPVVGIVSGCIITANAKALANYYVGLRHHNQLYYYLLGNGATHRQAIDYFFKKSLKTSIITVAKSMSNTVFTTAPIIFFIAVISGIGVFQAFILQLTFYGAIMTASLLSLFISLLVGRKYSFDEYDRLKAVFTHAK